MRRTILLTTTLSFAAAFIGTALAFYLLVPAVVEAQEARLRAESVAVVGAGGDLIRMTTKLDGQASDLSFLAPDGTTRLNIAAGGIAVADPTSSGITIYAEDGTRVGRLGIGRGPAGNLPVVSMALILSDQGGQARIRLSVEENGTPAMLMYDADGAVVWSAP